MFSCKNWELYLLKVIRNEEKGLVPTLLRIILTIFSYPYSWFVNARNWAYDHGWFRSYYPPVPLVISIGNITVGGTGKTPATLLIAEQFYHEVPLAVLSRGYRSQAEKFSTPVLLSKGQGALHPASYCGDEPFLIAQNLPKAFVVVGKNRHLSSNIAARNGAQLILLDDGMQHRGVARDLEVVVIDSRDPFGFGHYLPRGLLRDSVKSLQRADLIILNHSHDKEKFEQIKRQISSQTCAPIVGTIMDVEKVIDLNGVELDSLQGKKVGIFCGIAHPDYFRQTVQQLGAEIVSEYFLPDHDALDLERLHTFAYTSLESGADFIVCTEKDRVKISNPIQLPLPIVWIKSRLRVVEGEKHWATFIYQAKTTLQLKI